MTRSGFGMTGRAVLGAALMVCATAASVRAQVIAMLDPSARSGGMGGASVAVGWSGAGDGWLNPRPSGWTGPSGRRASKSDG